MNQKVDVSVEKALLAEITSELPLTILERFSTLVRESGSEDERIAADYLAGFLKDWDVPHQIHTPDLYLSVPKKSSLHVTASIEKEYRIKSPSFSVITGDEAITGEVVYIPTGYAKGINDIFGADNPKDMGDLTGKVILTEGFPMPGKVQEFTDKGAAAMLFISPGNNIHEGICTTIW